MVRLGRHSHPNIETSLMSAPAPAPAPAPATPSRPSPPTEIKLYSHSTLFYWWPVWLLALILAALTAFQGTTMVIVRDKELAPEDKVKIEKQQDGTDKATLQGPTTLAEPDKPHLKVTTHRGYGVLFVMILLVVIFITNVPLRGMWSV